MIRVLQYTKEEEQLLEDIAGRRKLLRVEEQEVMGFALELLQAQFPKRHERLMSTLYELAKLQEHEKLIRDQEVLRLYRHNSGYMYPVSPEEKAGKLNATQVLKRGIVKEGLRERHLKEWEEKKKADRPAPSVEVHRPSKEEREQEARMEHDRLRRLNLKRRRRTKARPA